MLKKAWIRFPAVLSILITVLWHVSSSAEQAPSRVVTDAPTSWNLANAAKPYRGKRIRLIGEDYPPLQAIEKMKSAFEKTTGIEVEVERYEAEAVLQKIAFDLNSRTGRYDLIIQVYFDMGRLTTRKQLRPLTDFFSSPRLHNPTFDPETQLFPVWKTMGWYKGKRAHSHFPG